MGIRIEIPKRTPRGEKIMLARYKKKNPAYVEARQLHMRMEKDRWHVFDEWKKETQLSLTINLPEKNAQKKGARPFGLTPF